ncbi:t-SNARE complex subunit/syntaxin [Spraguea lophii 42_110]|uniref:t-SNARE complex subunit/syntaxin n=1 Tax=Spraguea lophii (strain 42_110) TaxID=1358809 RepID=S7W9D8_SPRLO|nr:t-SNARE complex subunit/syntaxin [Spraguea lophii 42_110]
MNEFLNDTRKISLDIKKSERYLNKLIITCNRKLHSILDEDEEKQTEKRIEIINDLFKQQITQIKFELKEMGDKNTHLKENSKDKFLIVTRNAHWQSLTKKFNHVVDEYRLSQLDYNREEQERLKSQYLIAHPDATKEQLDDLLNTEKSDNVIKSAFVCGSHSSKNILNKAKQRNQNIKQIVKRIQEICEMMNELKEMIQSHGEIIDKIEINVSKAKFSTAAAIEDLSDALYYQRSAMTFKRIIYTILSIVVIGIIISLLIALSVIF